ncbi:MAG TPA: DUF4258 domain-containing protein [Flavobacterium sp.]|jgi:hypothetical protein
MKFSFRLAYYLGGFAVGMVFLLFILNGKDASCNYFPNARVLKHLRSKPFVYSDPALQKMRETSVDTADIRKILTYGDVDFDRSNVKSNGGNLYTIEGRNNKNEPVTVEIVNFESRAVLKDVRRTIK